MASPASPIYWSVWWRCLLGSAVLSASAAFLAGVFAGAVVLSAIPAILSPGLTVLSACPAVLSVVLSCLLVLLYCLLVLLSCMLVLVPHLLVLLSCWGLLPPEVYNTICLEHTLRFHHQVCL